MNLSLIEINILIIYYKILVKIKTFTAILKIKN